jgi:uncharacterized protein (TIGR02646 family)
MRRIIRIPLADRLQGDLDRKQQKANQKQRQEKFSVAKEWKTARRSKLLQTINSILKSMMGRHERCMYCLDSHGTDIDHFWPKSNYPEKMFAWPNLLLCCTECGRFKGTRFPLQKDGAPLLIDPTAEDPWRHLDFDPETGNLVARFDITTNHFSSKGEQTVEILWLDRREALASGYRRTFLRLKNFLSRRLSSGENLNAAELVASLRDKDDHGLLEWCFLSTGQKEHPFSALRSEHTDVWEACVAILQRFEEPTR